MVKLGDNRSNKKTEGGAIYYKNQVKSTVMLSSDSLYDTKKVGAINRCSIFQDIVMTQNDTLGRSEYKSGQQMYTISEQ